MFFYVLKLIISSVLIVTISEVAKRHSGLAALLASLPLTSLIAIIWLYVDGVELEEISNLSMQIFWLVLPSLVFFITFPLLLKQGLEFWLSMLLACCSTITIYFVFLPILRRLGIEL